MCKNCPEIVKALVDGDARSNIHSSVAGKRGKFKLMREGLIKELTQALEKTKHTYGLGW